MIRYQSLQCRILDAPHQGCGDQQAGAAHHDDIQRVIAEDVFYQRLEG
jgi:hypothetical protein